MKNIIDETYCPANRKEWRKWLEKNHQSSQSIWLIYYKTTSSKHNLSWSEAVEEALCFGWIDSVRKTLDEERFVQFFSKRKPKSTWSKINKEKVSQLIEQEQMTPAGLECIAIAKENGSWTILDQVEDLIVPKDLEEALSISPDSKSFFESLSKSNKKIILHWIVFAKRPETRQKRIAEVAESASKGLMPKNFR